MAEENNAEADKDSGMCIAYIIERDVLSMPHGKCMLTDFYCDEPQDDCVVLDEYNNAVAQGFRKDAESIMWYIEANPLTRVNEDIDKDLLRKNCRDEKKARAFRWALRQKNKPHYPI